MYGFEGLMGSISSDLYRSLGRIRREVLFELQLGLGLPSCCCSMCFNGYIISHVPHFAKCFKRWQAGRESVLSLYLTMSGKQQQEEWEGWEEWGEVGTIFV